MRSRCAGCEAADLPSNLVAILCACCLAVTACGSQHAGSNTATKGQAHAAKRVPAYRGGQYCAPSREARYRAAGFSCEHRHLVKP
jgi:hypothetical protein